MKIKRKNGAISLALAVALCLALLCGCIFNRFDPETYVKGGLDTLYHGEVSEDYLKLVVESREECLALYEENVANEAENFGQMFYVYINDAPEESLVQLYKDIFALSKYEVGEAEKNEEGYTVPVTVYPIDLFENCYDALDEYDSEFTRRFSEGEFEDTDGSEIEKIYLQGLIDILREELPGAGYLDPVTVELRLTENADGVYVINDEDYAELHKNIIAY